MTYMETINEILTRYPDLTVGGLDCAEFRDDWTKYEDAFQPCLDYIATLKRTKGYSKYARGSYGLKHDVEYHTEAQGNYVYVPNGVMIAALIHSDVPFKRLGINVMPKLVKAKRVK